MRVKVYPSGSDLTPCSMPSRPPAPGRFSTTTCALKETDSRWAAKRAMKSEPPPGAKGTMMCTGLAGQAWGAALSGRTAAASRAKKRMVIRLRSFAIIAALKHDQDRQPGQDLRRETCRGRHFVQRRARRGAGFPRPQRRRQI